MKLAIMQPYFFPYIGYWQLLHIADTFVIYDDVNYIKQGYINRNSILIQNQAKRITLEVLGASSNKLINEVFVGNNTGKILKSIDQSYKKSPKYTNAFPLIKKILENPEKNLSYFLGDAIKMISDYLNIDTNIVYSSKVDKNNSLRAQGKVIHICEILGASHYINSIGGKYLYNKEFFQKKDIKLSFLKTEPVEYIQFKGEYVPYLSIIDIIMFNSKKEIQHMLGNYKLI